MSSQKGLDFLLKTADSGTTATVNTSTDVWTLGAAQTWASGQAVVLTTTGTLPAGSAPNTIYYVNVATTTTVTLHTNKTDAVAGTNAVNLTDTGSGTHTMHALITLAGMRATSMTLANEAVDVTTKDSAGARTLLAAAGVQTLQIQASGIFTDATIEATVRGYAFDLSLNRFQLFFGNADTLAASFYITNYQRAGNYNGEETYSLTLESSGALSYVTAP